MAFGYPQLDPLEVVLAIPALSQRPANQRGVVLLHQCHPYLHVTY